MQSSMFWKRYSHLAFYDKQTAHRELYCHHRNEKSGESLISRLLVGPFLGTILFWLQKRPHKRLRTTVIRVSLWSLFMRRDLSPTRRLQNSRFSSQSAVSVILARPLPFLYSLQTFRWNTDRIASLHSSLDHADSFDHLAGVLILKHWLARKLKQKDKSNA